MSAQRAYSQRNTNLTQVIPTLYPDALTFGNITSCAVYVLPISQAHFVGGQYYVDMSGVDLSGNSLNYDGTFAALNDISGNTLPIICFAIDIDTIPSVYPGLDLTIYFKNLTVPLLTIGIISMSSLQGDTIPLPYIVSPPFPPLAGINISPNITVKSDGDNFDVVASGPAGWLGVPALSAILAAYTGFGL